MIKKDIVDLLDDGSLDPMIYSKAAAEIKRLRKEVASLKRQLAIVCDEYKELEDRLSEVL